MDTMFCRSRIDWTLTEKQRMPHTVLITRVSLAGGHASELEIAADRNCVVLAPTLAVREGCCNPVVQYVLHF